LPLPNAEWKFHLDQERVGTDEQWYEVGFDDSDWADIGIGRAWGEFGYTGYIGVGWYRRTISVPENPGATDAVLWFEGVDECAWVWINGQYAGEHDIGPAGWDIPFRIDVTDLIRWGEDNQITVRAMNTVAAGGIWQPVTLHATRVAP
jgi:beta-galactosidase